MPPPPSPQTSRPSFVVIAAITVTGITVNTLISPSLPDILDGLGASRGLAGVLIGAATLPGILLAPVIGILADRYGRREVLVPSLIVYALAGGLGGLAPNLWTLVGLRFLQGAGSAGLINLAVVLIGDYWDGTRRAAMIGRNSAVLTVCLALFPTLGGVLTDLGSWRTPFALYPLALITAVVVARYIPAGETTAISVREQLGGLTPILRRYNVSAVMAATAVAFALIFGAILTVLPLYAEARFGLGATGRGVLLGLPAIGSTIASLMLGRTTAWLGRRRLLTLAVVVGTAGLVAVALSPTVALLGTATVIYGLFEGTTIPSLQDMAAAAGGSEHRGGTVAVQVASARLGQTLGPIGLGAAYEGLGGQSAYLVAAVGVSILMVPLVRIATSEPIERVPGTPTAPPR